MAWTANLDSFERSSSGLGVVAHVTFTDGTLATTEAITVDCMTAQSLANIVADRLAGYQSREDAMATLAVGPITPGIKSSEQQLRDTLATARDLLKQSGTPFAAQIDDVLTTTAPTPVLATATSPAAKVSA
jgi:hypothetical protein